MNVTTASAAIKLMTHQAEFLRWRRSRCALWWEPGTGKTAAVLAAMVEDPLPTVVVCPLSVTRSAWAQDALMFPDLDVRVLHGTQRQRAEALDALASPGRLGAVVTNYETFRTQAVRRELLARGVRRLVIDESSKLKNPGTIISRACIDCADRMDQVILMSGTPAPGGPDEYWAQLRCLDGRTGGAADAPWNRSGQPDFWRWSRHWLRPDIRPVFAGGRSREVIAGWSVRPDRADGFHALISAAGQRLTLDECVDVPQEVDVTVHVDLSPQERRAYDSVEDRLILELDNAPVSKVHARAQLTKLRQLSCGFAYGPGGQDRWVDGGSSKLRALADLSDSLTGEQLVVWAEHTAELEAAQRIMEDGGRRVGRLDGTSGGHHEVIARFQAGDLDAVACHPKSVGHGVTLHRARYSAFLSLGFSPEEHQQARGRVRRKGQLRKVVHYYLMADGTVDWVTLKVLRRKCNESDGVLEVVRDVQRRRAGR